MFNNLLFVAEWAERHTYIHEQHINQPAGHMTTIVLYADLFLLL